VQSAEFASLLARHIPEAAVPYCLQQWEQTPFQFKVRASRTTKLGDFTCRPGRAPRITVNADCHPYLFLITYLHEVAHLKVHLLHGWKKAPHGQEWKAAFRELCNPLLERNIFPEGLRQVLQSHLQNPTASSLTDTRLTRALRQLDPGVKESLMLADLPHGSRFQIRGRWFQKVEHKRTRVLCRELSTRRQYLIQADVLVGN
jgi:hypothetical protein